MKFLTSIDSVNSEGCWLNKKFTESKGYLIENLKIIQETLIKISSDIPCSKDYIMGFDDNISHIEDCIDKMAECISDPKFAGMPWKNLAASWAYEVRTRVRTSERLYWKYMGRTSDHHSVGKYLNRLADFFSTLSRFLT